MYLYWWTSRLCHALTGHKLDYQQIWSLGTEAGTLPALVSFRDVEPDGQRGLLQEISLQTQAEELMWELLQADKPVIVQGDCALDGSLLAHSTCAQVVS